VTATEVHHLQADVSSYARRMLF